MTITSRRTAATARRTISGGRGRAARLSVALGTGNSSRHDHPIQFKRVECKEKQRLTEEYFDAFKRQQGISQRLKSIRADGDPRLISVGEKQAEAATEECYDAWHALNEHQCSERCERG